jgi:hypothetical protein
MFLWVTKYLPNGFLLLALSAGRRVCHITADNGRRAQGTTKRLQEWQEAEHIFKNLLERNGESHNRSQS